MTQTVIPTEVATYLAAVREALGDLGPDERDDLLIEVEASLVETAGEDGGLTARLGPPADFAAELRASAGLPPAAAAAQQPSPAAQTSPLSALRASAAEVGADPRIRAAGRMLGELTPIWWLARAYVAVILVTRLAGADWSISHPAITRFGHQHVVGLLLLAAAVGSVAVGLRRRGRPAGRTAILVNVVLAVAAVPAGIHFAEVATAAAPRDAVFVPVAASAPGLSIDGRPVHNMYPYTRDGRLLHDVLLFDSLGRPLDVNPGDTDPTRQVLLAADGQKIFDSFPIRYFDPGTQRVSKPNAAPPLVAPSLFTLPLRPAHR